MNHVLVRIRAVSGTSGIRVPDNRLGYPNWIFGSGTRNVASWEQIKDGLTPKNGLIRANLDVSVIESLYFKCSVVFCQLNKNKYDISVHLKFYYKITACYTQKTQSRP